VEGRGRPTLFLKIDERGRLWGGPHFGQTLWWMDPRTKKIVNTGTVCDAGGEVYDVTFLDGKVYTASYAGGDITCYDPKAPWDQWNHKNPRPLATVGPAYIRPTGGILTGPDGKLYSGWMARYGAYGGAVAITDPVTGKTNLIENPLGELAVVGLAVDGKYAYVGTSTGANGLPNKPGESAKFGVIDLTSGQAVFTHTFEGAQGVQPVTYEAQTKRVAMVVQGRLQVFDPRKHVFITGLTENLPRVTSSSIAAPGDGKVYVGSEKAVLAIDLTGGKVQPVGEVPANVTNVSVGAKGAVYVSCGADVYRIRKGR